MPLAGPFIHADFGATPETVALPEGGVAIVYPPLAGVFCICDLAEFARSQAQLEPFRVFPVPAQSVLAGDDPAAPHETVTLHFADVAEAEPVIAAVNALPPIPAPAPPPPVVEAPVRKVLNYRFKIALRSFPSVNGPAPRTLRDDVDAMVATLGGAVADRFEAPEIFRNDPMLLAQALTLAGGDADAAAALLDAIYDAADLVP